MNIHDATETSYRNGYEAGYQAGEEKSLAEIERLKARNNELNELNKMASIEAIKEFEERLKKEALKHKIFPLDSCVDFDDIDNLVKEMTEGRENDN